MYLVSYWNSDGEKWETLYWGDSEFDASVIALHYHFKGYKYVTLDRR